MFLNDHLLVSPLSNNHFKDSVVSATRIFPVTGNILSSKAQTFPCLIAFVVCHKSFLNSSSKAFAACSSALYNEKTTGQPVANKNEWYHGWKQANDLTRQMYPLFKEYIKTGKPFDDAFADRLSRAIKIDRLKNNETNLSKENKSSIAD